MRKVAVATLALPILVIVYLRSLVRDRRFVPSRRSTRIAAAAGLVALAVVVAGYQLRPVPTSATPPSRPSTVPAAAFTSKVEAGTSPAAPVTITFGAPMDPRSVAANLLTQPATEVSVSWDESGTVLTVVAIGGWQPGTFHTITVAAGALESSGRPLVDPIRASFLTRSQTVGSITVTGLINGEATVASHFRVTFDRPIDEETLDLLVEPVIEGSIVPDPAASPDAPSFDFVPADSLDPDVVYTVRLAPGSRDADGMEIASVPLEIRTAAAPAVVRFRPRDGWKDVVRGQALSVRFTEPMDRDSTQAAWTATAGGAAIPGTFAWAEGDTVMIFKPGALLGYGQAVVMTVGTTARSAAGLPLGASASATFTTAGAPVTPRRTSSGGGSGSIGSSAWVAVEAYYLGLMNCTRTGGWVSSSGSCSGAGSGSVPALAIDAGITASVARPYAKKLAENNLCTHFSGGTPGDRLLAAGYTSHYWAENLGCRSGDPYAAVLGSHLFFQSEKSYNGGHYRNLMNPIYERVGVGVWVSGGRVRLVVDFYHVH